MDAFGTRECLCTCVRVLPLRGAMLSSHAPLLLLSFVILWNARKILCGYLTVCVCAFVEINCSPSQAAPLCIVPCCWRPLWSPTKLFNHMHQRVAMKTSWFIKISATNAGTAGLFKGYTDWSYYHNHDFYWIPSGYPGSEKNNCIALLTLVSWLFFGGSFPKLLSSSWKGHCKQGWC